MQEKNIFFLAKWFNFVAFCFFFDNQLFKSEGAY